VVPNPVSRSKQELRDLDKKAQKEKAAEAKKKQQGAAH
jgi:cell division protein FtsB